MEHFLGRPVEPSEIDGYHAGLRAEAERRGVQPYPGIPEALEALARSVALAVFTNADLGNVDVLLGAAGLRDRFAVVVGADEVAPNFKPAADGLLLACERLEVSAARTAYVGDSPQDGETAHRAAALAVAARWGHLMEDVGGFDVVADQPTDLPAVLGLT
jgi:HAD superfamily hydrolase (TIGR01549 family)